VFSQPFFFFFAGRVLAKYLPSPAPAVRPRLVDRARRGERKLAWHRRGEPRIERDNRAMDLGILPRRTFVQILVLLLHLPSYLNPCNSIIPACCSRSTPSHLPTMSGEKLSPTSSNDDKAAVQTKYVDLDEQRRAALAEIDNAPFSYVDSAYRPPSAPFSSCVIGGSTSAFAWSLVLVSSPTRMWSCDRFRYRVSPLTLVIATISSPSTSPPSCWVMSTVPVSS